MEIQMQMQVFVQLKKFPQIYAVGYMCLRCWYENDIFVVQRSLGHCQVIMYATW